MDRQTNPLHRCSQDGCGLLPYAHYTWPGKDEAAVCLPHAEITQNIARGLGLHLQLIELTPEQVAEAERAMAEATP